MSASKMSGYTAPQTGTKHRTPDVDGGRGRPGEPLGFMGTTLVPEMIVSDAVFDGLSDRMQQLGRSLSAHDRQER